MTQPHTLLPASRTAVTWAICICMHLLCATVAAARDSSYIARSESRMAFKLFANNDFLSVIREYRDKEYTYKCNRPICLGIGASYIMIRNMVRPDGSPQTARPMHGVMFGPSVGYSYCWVFLKDLYVNLGATLGIDFSAGDIDWGIFPSAVPRIGIGYDNSQWAVFMNYKNHIVFPSISADDRIGISSGTITLGCAYRIL